MKFLLLTSSSFEDFNIVTEMRSTSLCEDMSVDSQLYAINGDLNVEQRITCYSGVVFDELENINDITEILQTETCDYFSGPDLITSGNSVNIKPFSGGCAGGNTPPDFLTAYGTIYLATDQNNNIYRVSSEVIHDLGTNNIILRDSFKGIELHYFEDFNTNNPTVHYIMTDSTNRSDLCSRFDFLSSIPP